MMWAVKEVRKPVEEIVAEIRQILAAAQRENIPLRAIGGLAVRLRATAELPRSLTRTYQDIDLFAAKGSQSLITPLLEGLGYAADQHFNAAHGDRRLLFVDSNGGHIDVFVGIFQLCHLVPIPKDRVVLDPLTLPLAELLMTKLQIVQLNEKDQRDILTLLHEHDVGPADEETINFQVVASALASDWGLWRTSTANIVRTSNAVANYRLAADRQAQVHERLDRLAAQIESHPKSRRWRMRARVGERMRWYEEPEEEPEG